ncbi:MAG: KH domain-containing protein [Lachnospiraceae bacterium]|nr:KH domain-containing protein [Lachnospiraceae bacterium]
MSQEYIEITEKTVDDAITTACQRLSVTSNRLDYIIVQREKSGFLGIGAKPAIIKARVKDAADATQAILDDVIGKAEKKIQKELNVKSSEKKENKPSAPATKEEKKAPKKVEKEVKAEKKEAEKTEKKELKEKDKDSKKSNKKNKKKSSAPKKAEAETPAAAVSAAPVEEKAAPAPKKKAVIPQLTDEKIAEVKKAAHDFLVGVFKTMDMNVDISEEYQKETGILTVNMEGEDMGVLIGKRGQTLDSLQYLVSLVVNKDIDGYIHVKADTENYRERRKKTLENLAKNIAFKVKRTRQPVALEPMNPYERRIIHSALQDEKFITTYSEGEEPYRKVVVALKKDENGEDLLKEERFEKGGRGRNGRGRNGRGRKGRDYRGSKDNRRGSDRSAENKSESEE